MVEHRDYDPFGDLDVLYDQSGAQKSGTVALDSVFAFAGREWDEEAQLYYNRARYYDPNTARFLGEDPALSDPNLYRYAGNDPVNFRDPSGLATMDSFYDFGSSNSLAWDEEPFFIRDGGFDLGGLQSLGGLFGDGLNFVVDAVANVAAGFKTFGDGEMFGNLLSMPLPNVAPTAGGINDYFSNVAFSDSFSSSTPLFSGFNPGSLSESAYVSYGRLQKENSSAHSFSIDPMTLVEPKALERNYAQAGKSGEYFVLKVARLLDTTYTPYSRILQCVFAKRECKKTSAIVSERVIKTRRSSPLG